MLEAGIPKGKRMKDFKKWKDRDRANKQEGRGIEEKKKKVHVKWSSKTGKHEHKPLRKGCSKHRKSKEKVKGDSMGEGKKGRQRCPYVLESCYKKKIYANAYILSKQLKRV